MAGSNRFCKGNIIGYDGMIGVVKKNCKDFRYWEVEFKNCMRVIHFRDMVYLCENQAVYEAGLNE